MGWGNKCMSQNGREKQKDKDYYMLNTFAPLV